jgi:hypothetical protein
MRYTASLESPTIFHKWVAIATVGLALGRRVWLSREGKQAIFPGQVLITLVAPSAVVRKSTALEQGSRILRGVNDLPRYREGRDRPINILPDRASPQAAIYRLQPRNKLGEVLDDRDCVGAIIAGEMSSYFSQEGYLESWATHVTHLNDACTGQWNVKRRAFEPAWYTLDFRGEGETRLRNPCVGMLTATTPTDLAMNLPEAARTGGFLGRMLPVYAERTDRAPNPLINPDPPVDNVAELVEGLDLMLTYYKGLVRLTPEAVEFYTDFYREHLRQVTGAEIRGKPRTGYVSRRDAHLLRVGMILAAMTGAQDPERQGQLWIHKIHLRYALAMLTEIEKGFEDCFRLFDRGTLTGCERALVSLLGKPTAMKLPVGKARTPDYLIIKMAVHSYRAAQVRDSLRQLVAAGQLVREKAVNLRGVEDEGYRLSPLRPRAPIFFTREATAERVEDPPDGWEEEPQPENHLRLIRGGRYRGNWAEEASDDCPPGEDLGED